MKDIIGNKYNKLKATKHVNTIRKNTYTIHMYEFICDCGNSKIINFNNVKYGYTKSCGCLSKEFNKKLFTKHGFSTTRICRTWHGIIQRCLHKNSISYKHYGGRGISVCKEWKDDFMSFYNWANKNGYKKDLTIDRIDNNGNYTPDNCRWATRKEQNINKRNTRYIIFNGKEMLIQDWAKETGIKRTTIIERLKRGWSIKEALSKPRSISGRKAST